MAVLGLLATFGVASVVRGDQMADDSARFEAESRELRDELRNRVSDYSNLLRAAARFSSIAHPVTAEELATFTSRDLLAGYEGMRGITLITYVPSEDLTAFVEQRRSLDDPDFEARAAMPADDYFIITVATAPGIPIGTDLGGLAERREAFERALDSGRPAVTEAFTLDIDRQLPESERQPAFAIYAPFYRVGAPVGTVDERRAAVLGFATTALRGQDFLDDAVRPPSGLSFALLDGSGTQIGGGRPEVTESQEPSLVLPAAIGGRAWTIRTVAASGFDGGSWRSLWWIFLAGIGVTAPATALVSQQLSRGRALREAADRAVAGVSLERARRELIFDTAHEGLVLQDADGVNLEWNPATERILGLTADQLAERAAHDDHRRALDASGAILHTEDHPSVIARRSGKPVVDRLIGMGRPDGSLVWVMVNARPVFDPATGALSGVVVGFIDVTTLRTAEARSRASLDALEQGVALVSLDREVLTLNEAGRQMLGYEPAELTSLIQSGAWEVADEHGTPLPIEDRPLEHTIRTGEAVRDRVLVWTTKTGDPITVRAATQPVLDVDGALTGVVAAFSDIAGELEAWRAIEATTARFEALVERSTDIICLVDGAGDLVYASPAGARLLGHESGSMTGRPFTHLLHPDDAAMVTDVFRALQGNPGGVASVEARVLATSGEWRHLEIVATNRLEDPAVQGIVANVRDVTERAEAAARLTWQAFHDPLTSLPNRALLLDRLAHAIEQSKRHHRPMALMFIDLDGFKAVNDEHGHATGDAVLVEASARLTSVLRAGDTVARLGGDEFVLLAEVLDGPEEAVAIADRILAAVRRPMVVGERELTVRASVGIALDAGDDADALLRAADTALYRAKAMGGDQHATYDPHRTRRG